MSESLTLQVLTLEGELINLSFPGSRVTMKQIEDALVAKGVLISGSQGFALKGTMLNRQTVITNELLDGDNTIVTFNESFYPSKSYATVSGAFPAGQKYDSLYNDPSAQRDIERKVSKLSLSVISPGEFEAGEGQNTEVSEERRIARELINEIMHRRDGGDTSHTIDLHWLVESGQRIDRRQVLDELMHMLNNGPDYIAGTEEEDGYYDGEEEDFTDEEDGGPDIHVEEISGHDFEDASLDWDMDIDPEEDDPIDHNVMDQYSPEEQDAIHRLLDYGLDFETTVSVYESCDRDEETAIACLISMQS